MKRKPNPLDKHAEQLPDDMKSPTGKSSAQAKPEDIMAMCRAGCR